FKMPLYPFSNYLVFLYMTFVCVVLFLGKDTRIALLLTPVWFLLLLLIYHMKYERKK
ncbi:amino acid permease, partial [Enterococcus faecium]